MVYSQKAAEHTDLRPGLILIPHIYVQPQGDSR